MSPAPAEQPAGGPPPTDDESDTGLPRLRTWRSVYAAVFAVFVLWVVLLAAFTQAYR